MINQELIHVIEPENIQIKKKKEGIQF